MKPLYIFDLDGTIADVRHRRGLIDLGKWDEFHNECDKDTPNAAVVAVLNSLIILNNDIYIFSGRDDIVRDKTEKWLSDHTYFPDRTTKDTLWMRAHGDYTPDEKLKLQWYTWLPEADKNRLVAVFDDRNKVVDMWRGLGVPCFQVAPGDF